MALDIKQQDATALAEAIAKGVLTAREAMDAAIEAAENGALWAPLHISTKSWGAEMRSLLITTLHLPECRRFSKILAAPALACRSGLAHAPAQMRRANLIQNSLPVCAKPGLISSGQQPFPNSVWRLQASRQKAPRSPPYR